MRKPRSGLTKQKNSCRCNAFFSIKYIVFWTNHDFLAEGDIMEYQLHSPNTHAYHRCFFIYNYVMQKALLGPVPDKQEHPLSFIMWLNANTVVNSLLGTFLQGFILTTSNQQRYKNVCHITGNRAKISTYTLLKHHIWKCKKKKNCQIVQLLKLTSNFVALFRNLNHKNVSLQIRKF